MTTKGSGSNRNSGFVAISVVIFAGPILVYSLYAGIQSAILVARGETANATCTRMIESRSGEPRSGIRTTWEVRFESTDGVSHTGKIDAFMSGLLPGGTIEVLYDPHNFERVQANRWISLWKAPAFCFAMLALLAIVTWRHRRRMHLTKEEEE